MGKLKTFVERSGEVATEGIDEKSFRTNNELLAFNHKQKEELIALAKKHKFPISAEIVKFCNQQTAELIDFLSANTDRYAHYSKKEVIIIGKKNKREAK